MHSKWTQAFKMMVDGYPALANDPDCKGLPALCSVMGWPYETARKEIAGVNAKLGFEQAMQAMQVCEAAGGKDCFALRDALDAARIAGKPIEQDASMSELMARAMKELADVATAHADAMRDGSYSDNDLRRMNKEILEALSAVIAVGAGAEAEHAKSTNLRAVK